MTLFVGALTLLRRQSDGATAIGTCVRAMNAPDEDHARGAFTRTAMEANPGYAVSAIVIETIPDAMIKESQA